MEPDVEYLRKLMHDNLIVVDTSWGILGLVMEVTPEEWAAWHDRSYQIDLAPGSTPGLYWDLRFTRVNRDWTALDVGY